MSAQQKQAKAKEKQASKQGGKTNWSAVQNRQPPAPWRIHVEGNPQMPTPGHKPALTKAAPQGSNPRMLILDLRATPPSTPTPQVVTRVPVRYEDRSNLEYDQVDIRSHVNTESGILLTVEVVQ